MPIAYSYKRFSSDAQSQGDSLRRQTDLAQKYIQAHPELNLVLDTALNLTDLGVSAFKGDNMTTGALGKFLEAVYQGHIPRGSYLLIESFDRFSRQQANVAAAELLNLVNKGIIVVTLNNEQTYRSEDFSDGTNGLVAFLGAFIAMEGAHREQVNKGKRIAAAWASKWSRLKEETREGGKPSKILTKHRPFWLDENLNPIPEKVEIIREIFDKKANLGLGKQAIANSLNERGVIPPKGRSYDDGRPKPWNTSTIDRLLNSMSPIGVFVNAHGEEISGYYPRIVDEATFLKVRAIAKAPVVKGQSPDRRHPLTGLVKHKQCGQVLRRINKGKKGGPIKLACLHCNATRPFTQMLESVEIALRSLEHADIEEMEAGAAKELMDLELAVPTLEGAVEDLYEIYRRVKTPESKAAYEKILNELSDHKKSIKGLRGSNLTIVLNMEDQALTRHMGGIGAAPAVIKECSWDSDSNTIELQSFTGRRSRVWIDMLN